MSTQILFRSQRAHGNRFGTSQKQTLQRGTSWTHLRDYDDRDDIRDIAWKKIKPDGLSVRVREENGEFQIYSYWGSRIGDTFCLDEDIPSRQQSLQHMQDIIRKSTHLGGYIYHEYAENEREKLLRNTPKESLVLIWNTEITPDIALLAKHNDLIYLDIFHPFEKDPDQSLLFLGKDLDREKYRQAFAESQEQKRNLIKSLGASYISLSTHENIPKSLNLFFKYRYGNHRISRTRDAA